MSRLVFLSFTDLSDTGADAATALLLSFENERLYAQVGNLTLAGYFT